MTKITIKIASSMVVRVSIVNDSDIYRLPNRKLKTVKQNTKKRNELGEMGYQMVMDELNSKVMSKKTLNVYENIKKSSN